MSISKRQMIPNNKNNFMVVFVVFFKENCIFYVGNMLTKENTCRTCLSTDEDFVDMATLFPREPEGGENIINFFKVFLKFDISGYNDELPQIVCFKCFDRFVDVREFYLQCKISEIHWEKQLKTLKNNILDSNRVRPDSTIVIELSDDEDKLIECLPDLHYIGAEESESQAFDGCTLTDETGIIWQSSNLDGCDAVGSNNNSFHQDNNIGRTPVQTVQHNNVLYSQHNEDFSNLQSLERHPLKVFTFQYKGKRGRKKKIYSCTYCQKICMRKDIFECHLRTHTGERPFQCEICEKRFTQKSSLTTHMTLHTGKTIKCPVCDKKFSRTSFLKIHHRQHTDERPYSCSMCPKKYRQMTHLRSHESTHFKTKPFLCNICGKTFTQQSTLRQHLVVHDENPFKCPECPSDWLHLNKFRNHLLFAHNIQFDANAHYERKFNNFTNDMNKDDQTTSINVNQTAA